MIDNKHLYAKSKTRPSYAKKGEFLRYCATYIFVAVLALFTSVMAFSNTASAATNSTINFQSRILLANGSLVPDGNYHVEFKIYNDPSLGAQAQGTCSANCLWKETHTTGNLIRVVNGYVSVSLGDATSGTVFPATLPWDQNLYITMRVGGNGGAAVWDATEMTNATTGRMKMSATPYAFRAAVLMNAAGTAGFNADQLVQLGPGSPQAINSTTPAISVNQTGAGTLLDLRQAGTSKLTVDASGNTVVLGVADVRGASVSVGTATQAGSVILSDGSANTTTLQAASTASNLTFTLPGTLGVNGDCLTTNGAGVLNFSSACGAGGALSVNPTANLRKPADQTQTSVTNPAAVLTNDSDLKFNIGANETWSFRFVAFMNSGTVPDIKFAVTAPAGATCTSGVIDGEGAVAVGNLACGVSSGLIAGSGAEDVHEIMGTVVNGPTAGTVQLQWAQNTASAVVTVVRTGSYLTASRITGPTQTAQAFVQNGNSFGATGVIGTNDTQALSVLTNGVERLRVLSTGNVGIGVATPASLFSVGTASAFQVNTSGNISTTGTATIGGLSTMQGSVVASGAATATTATAAGTAGLNTTTITTSAAHPFVINDVIFINNAGQDYYTRVVAVPTATTMTVTPVISYDVSAPLTKYIVQNIGATPTDYTTQANRFYQGYFLGGVIVGAGSTTLSDGSLSRTAGDIQINPGAGGIVNVGGTINATSYTGDGSAITNINSSSITGSTITGINAANLATGTIADVRLSSNVDLLDATQTITGAKTFSSLLSGTSLNATVGINTGVGIGTQRIDAAGNLVNIGTVTSGLVNGQTISSAANFTGSLSAVGAITAASFTGDGSGLTNIGGASLTGLNASNISSGTLNDSRLSSNVALLSNTQTFTGVKTFGAGAVVTTGQTLTVNGDVFTDFTGSGLQITSGALNVVYGSTAGSSVQGNTSLTCPAGTGNLSGGGTAITLGAGGVCGAISTNNAVSFTTSVSSPLFTGTGAVSLASGAAADLTLDSASNVLVLSDATLRRTSAGTTTFELNDAANTTFAITNTNGVGVASLTVEGSVTATSFAGDGSGLTNIGGASLTNLNASNISSGTLNDLRLSSNVALLNTAQTFTALKTFSSGIVSSTSVSSPLHTGVGAVTLSSGGATTLTLDTGGAAAIDIGQVNASAVNIGKAGITTAIAGNTSLTTLDGAGLADCKSINSKLLYDATLKQFLCGNDRGSNIIRKTAAESVSSANTGATLQPDNHMFFNVGANETWFVVVSGSEAGANAGGMRAGMSVPAGSVNCTYNLGDNYNAASNTATSATCVNTTSAFIAAASWFTSDNFSYSGVFTTGATAGTATFQWAQNTASATNLTLPIDAYMTAYKLTGADLAEVYYTSDPGVSPGDVISISGNGVSQVKKSSVAYESNAIGIVSTRPGQVVGENDGTGHTVLVGLSGRVPVKVTSENGAIIPGDYLTASNTPGKAMKATRAGQIIGQALTGYSASEDGQLVAFIKNSYFDGKRADVQIVLDSVQLAGQQSAAVAANALAPTSSCIAAQTCAFLSIGSASAVADSSDNTSIAINKKSANGRLLVLQRDGKDVFTVGNDGGLVISASSTSALEIASAGQSIFRVDTVGKVVKIGDSGVATPVLFVLSSTDTKADPVGQNGASYYNNSAGKFRCYENGQWRNCLGTTSSEYSIVASPVDWSNVPILSTELGATDQNRAIVDMTIAKEFRVISTIQHAGNIDCRVQSSADGLLWADISLPTSVVSLSKIGLDKSDWLPINASSQKESTVRMMCTAPDNNQSVMLNSIKLQIR